MTRAGGTDHRPTAVHLLTASETEMLQERRRDGTGGRREGRTAEEERKVEKEGGEGESGERELAVGRPTNIMSSERGTGGVRAATDVKTRNNGGREGRAGRRRGSGDSGGTP